MASRPQDAADRPTPAPAPIPAARPRLSTVYGGGGPFGMAYAFGVADALAAGGVQLAGAQALGTSAGSWVAACLATGVPVEALADLPHPRVPNAKRGLLQRIATQLLDDAMSPLVSASAVRVPFGQRVLLSGADHRLADIVAASSAVPWLFPPVRLDGKWYADGGVRSLISADHAAPADHLLAVAPIGGAMFGPAGRVMEAALRNELRRWERATGGRAHLIRPNARIAGLARHPLDLFDPKRAREVYPMGYEQAARLLAERPGLGALVPVERRSA